MKTTATLSAIAIFAASFAQAQSEYDVCKAAGESYCAGKSLGTDIIIRCQGPGQGVAGRCSNNLAGYPPLGSTPSLCLQESDHQAACVKNCVVYSNSTYTLSAPTCTPTAPFESTSKAPQASFTTKTQKPGEHTDVNELCPTGITTLGPKKTDTTIPPCPAQCTESQNPKPHSVIPSPTKKPDITPTSYVTAGAGAIQASGLLMAVVMGLVILV